jgi:hypothetical protein
MRFFAIALLLATACRRNAVAQTADTAALGPIACFEVVDALGIASSTGLQLCTRATSSAPGDCFAAASARLPGLATSDLVNLCHGATTLETVECYESLYAQGGLTEQQVIGYCAMTCPLGPAPPQSSSAACVREGLDRTQLADQMIGELCSRSRSAMPVSCYLQGEASTQLSDSQLVELCTQNFSCQYVNTPPE